MTAHAAQTTQDYFIGADISGYRITAKIGEGAMGVVYRGEHKVLGRQAAIKFLSGSLIEQPELVSRFFTEARAVNGIRHPNIVDITDFGQRGNRHYYVMELLEGQTLMERLDSEVLCDTDSTIRIGMQVSAALAAAHDKGVVHRDLKPDNIFLCNHPDYPDYVKVFDFGIAKLLEQAPTASHKTQIGSVMGTPLYMSPEQCLGDESLDHRSDIYSLGVVLYKMVTGVVPFDEPTVAAIILSHIQDEPVPPTQHNDFVHPGIEKCILKALAKNPDDRYSTMREFRAALEACEKETESEADAHSEVEVATSPKKTFNARNRNRPGTVPPNGKDQNSEKLLGELIQIILERIEGDRLVLPAMPASAMAAIKELDKPNVTFRDISKIISNDPVLTPQIFRKASIAMYGGAERPKTIEQAIGRLGMSNLKVTLIELSAHQVYDSRNRKIRKAFKGIWDHSVAVGIASRLISLELDCDLLPTTAHLAGLMHDVGKPIVGALLLEAEKMLGLKKNDWLDEAMWLSVIDQSHRLVGTALAAKWELPPEVVRCIEGCTSYSAEEEDICANIVRFANAFSKRCGKAGCTFAEEEVEDIVTEGVELLGLDWIYVHDKLRNAILQIGQSSNKTGSSTRTL